LVNLPGLVKMMYNQEDYMSEEKTPDVIEKVKKFAKDGWSNLITGLNNARTAKKRHTHHHFDGLLQEEELESMFVEDGLAARIVKLIPDDMFREGWEYEFPDVDEIKAAEFTDKYDEVFEAIGAQTKLKLAFYWARLFGGAAILIGVVDGQTMDKPLNPQRIKSFEKLKIIDRTEIEFSRIQFQLDPGQPRYGLPVFYPIKFDTGCGAEEEKLVHYTRILELHGDTLPRKSAAALSEDDRYWGISVLQRAEDRLKTLGSSLGSIDQLLDEMSVGKYKVKNLAMMLASTEGEAAIKRRVELMDLTRSVFRSMYLDAGDEGGKGAEDFVRDTVNFTGIPEILHIIFMLLSADTGYPITRLFGVSPGGMNATGESDMRNYYDSVRSLQSTDLKPILLYLLRIISEWQKIPEPYIKFLPLETMNEKEQSELDKMNVDKDKLEADTYKVYVDMGALEPYEVRFLKFGNTLDNIPVPKDLELPPVETVPENGDPEDGPPAEGEDDIDPEAPDDDTGEDDKPPPPKPSKKKAGKS
jgi:phage-related protein (TIGR01555 family)